MPVVFGWLRLELHRRWRSLVVLALLIAIAAGVIITALAAARRGASALTRLEARTLPATVDVLPNKPGFDWAPIKALPEVAALSNFIVDYEMALVGAEGSSIDFPFIDDAMLSTLERPVVLAGRILDPTRVDEIVVTPKFVSSFHKGVGSTLVLELPSAKQLADSFTGENLSRFEGPRITLRIVGVVISPWLSDQPDSPGGVQLSPAVTHKYPLETIGQPGTDNTQFINALVRLRHGDADVDRFRTDVARVTGRNDIFIGNQMQSLADIQRHIAFESRCLVAFALAVFVAALFLVGQAIARYAASSTAELQTLQALGMTPRQAVATAAAGPFLAGVGGAAVGAIGAYIASQWFPFGTAVYFEATRGLSFDWIVTASGIALTILLATLGAAAAARIAVGASRRDARTRRSTVARAVARSSAPVPVVIGTRFAMEAGRGRTAVPVRPALVGSVIGVLGIVAAYTFAHGVSDAASNPSRFGQTFQLTDFAGLDDQDFGPAGAVYRSLAASDDVQGIADSRTSVATDPSGIASVSLWEFQSDPKPLSIVLLSGRLPENAGEIVLAPRTITALHSHVGGRLTLKGNRNGKQQVYLVTGAALVPEGPHNSYYDGGWVTSGGYDAIFTGFKFHVQLIELRHGLGRSTTAEAARLTAAVVKQVPQAKGLSLDPPDVPTELSVIRKVERLPIFLGGFLAVLAVGAVGHALATAVRRRAHDLAVLRAVGMTRWQCRWVVVTQASVLAAFGLVFGVPIGLALGRTVWRVVAHNTPVQYVPPLAVWALVLIGPAVLIVANVLAAWPGHQAARLRVAQMLRAE
jgi:ABC-type lipoprotein release transport system permease subunit